MADRAHLTIGEVLSLLRQEFPDVSISKIRFLESQGLVDPERTPSGYRKFYDHDVARLRWILQQQREHFLPLKVIRGRLFDPDGTPEDEEAFEPGPAPSTEPSVPSEPAASSEATRPSGPPEPSEPVPSSEPPLPSEPALSAEPRGPAAPSSEPGVHPQPPASSEPAVPAGAGAGLVAGEEPPEAGHDAPRADRVVPPTAPRPAPAGHGRPDEEVVASKPPAPAVVSNPPMAAAASSAGGSGQPDVYTAEELADAAGCEAPLVRDLCEYGLLVANASVAGVAYFDRDAVALAQTAARFAAVGVEPRHLRSWRNAADREASLFEQLVMPLLRQRNPQARRQAAALLDELADLGARLRAELMREAIRSIR